MASTFSFDVVSDFDRQELVNAIDQMKRDVDQRYDLKDSKTEIDLKEEELIITTASDITSSVSAGSLVKITNSDPKTAPEKAPTKSMPSIPIFIIATLSERIPANAAKAIGVALITVACIIPVKENDFPAVAQTKKQVTSKNKPAPR